jgi:hypothetical protein
VFTPDILPHIGRYCEISARGGRFFGELIRLSTALFAVRSTWPAAQTFKTLRADEIEAIRDLENPRS